jgi:hypothetical protein
MTLRQFIEQLNKAPESQKDKIVKYCGEWEGEITSIELSNFDGCVLLLLG